MSPVASPSPRAAPDISLDFSTDPDARPGDIIGALARVLLDIIEAEESAAADCTEVEADYTEEMQ